MRITKNIRILGIDDAPFNKNEKKVKIIGTLYRGINLIEGFIMFDITRDGLDMTSKLIKVIKESKFNNQISVIISKGLTFGGFNILDIKEIYEKINIPYIIVMRHLPNFDKIKNAINKLNHKELRLQKLNNAGPIKTFNNIFYQAMGLNKENIEFILKLSIKYSNIPEPIRISHLIGGALQKGESYGQV